jgi:hypothetical protein
MQHQAGSAPPGQYSENDDLFCGDNIGDAYPDRPASNAHSVNSFAAATGTRRQESDKKISNGTDP